ncbi:hypothetical protein WT60_12860 [Burkholderia sp. MSMB617WGS]|nr:hypothetical protein WT60_12860 [Burkholderia sp. MSMB617WGS]
MRQARPRSARERRFARTAAATPPKCGEHPANCGDAAEERLRVRETVRRHATRTLLAPETINAQPRCA